MGILERIREWGRTELPIQKEIIERERSFNSQDSGRERWLLQHTYLCEGDLEALKQNYNDPTKSYVMAYFAHPERKKGPCKKIRVSVKRKADEKQTVNALERELKLALQVRDCNAGVFYRRYKEGNSLVGEVVPAVVTGE